MSISNFPRPHTGAFGAETQGDPKRPRSGWRGAMSRSRIFGRETGGGRHAPRAWCRLGPLESPPNAGDGFVSRVGRRDRSVRPARIMRGRRRFAGVPIRCLTPALRPLVIIKSARAPERQSARAPERQSARAPERQSARAPERQSARAPERQSARAPEARGRAPERQRPERQSARAPERQSARAPERQSA